MHTTIERMGDCDYYKKYTVPIGEKITQTMDYLKFTC